MSLEKIGSCLIIGSEGLIGSSISKTLIDSNYDVIGIDIGLESTKSGIGKNKYRQVNLSNYDEVDNAIREIFHTTHKINGCVNASYIKSNTLKLYQAKKSAKDTENDITNLLSNPLIISSRILEEMRVNGKGSYVHISSIQGVAAPKFEHYQGTEMTSPIEYSAAKAGLIAIVKWQAKYYGGKGLRVNCVSPGGIEADQPEEFVIKYRNSTINKGLLNPEDVATCVKYLLSNESSGITGQNIIIDDGWTL